MFWTWKQLISFLDVYNFTNCIHYSYSLMKKLYLEMQIN